MEQAGIRMPQYQSHKKVRALKIDLVIAVFDHTSEEFKKAGRISHVELIATDKDFAPIKVTPEWNEKHQPQSGGYFVVYDDGYQSYSPAEAFESGYTLVKA